LNKKLIDIIVEIFTRYMYN